MLGFNDSGSVIMSIEGLWCFVSGEVGAEVLESGGIIVLDTQRIYGGDSAMAYVGNYSTQGPALTAEMESFLYNPAWASQLDVFGEPMGPVRRTSFKGQMEEDGFMRGALTRDGVSLPVVLKKLRDMP